MLKGSWEGNKTLRKAPPPDPLPVVNDRSLRPQGHRFRPSLEAKCLHKPRGKERIVKKQKEGKPNEKSNGHFGSGHLVGQEGCN